MSYFILGLNESMGITLIPSKTYEIFDVKLRTVMLSLSLQTPLALYEQSASDKY